MPRPKTGDTRKMVTLPAELAQAIEEYRFANRFKTEAEAIRRLIEAGLQALAPHGSAKNKLDRKRRS
jgi:Arc/MetJ-type ribon-helix-helix transcriptional regulator